MRALIVKRVGYEFLILPLNHQHPMYKEGNRFELYRKEGKNYLGLEIYAPTTYMLQVCIDMAICRLNHERGIENESK